MEEVARRNDAPLIPGRGFTISPAIDVDLRNRIRSLLASRNRQKPPKTPCPTPDYNYLPLDPDENCLGYAPIHTESYKFDVAQGIAKLNTLTPKTLEKGVTIFDGPAGHIEDDTDAPQEGVSQPDTQVHGSTMAEWAWSRPGIGVDQRTHGELSGREAPVFSSVSREKSTSSNRSAGSRIPRFNLRTVAPRNAQVIDKQRRQSTPHVPGSYVSSASATPTVEDPSKSKYSDVVNAQMYFGVNSERYNNAVNALHKATMHEPQAKRPPSILRERSSNTTLHSGGSGRPIPASLTQKSENNTYVDHAAEPSLQPADFCHRHSLSADDPVASADNSDTRERAKIELVPGTQSQNSREVRGPQFDNLLAQLPPLQSGVEKSPTNDQPDKSVGNPPNTVSPSGRSPSIRSLQSVPLDVEEDSISPVSPLLPKSTIRSASVEAVNRRDSRTPDDAVTALDRTHASNSTPKAAPLSRAFSVISEISARSGIKTPSIHSVTKRKASGPITPSNLTTRPYHRLKRIIQDAEQLRASVIPASNGYTSLNSEDEAERPLQTESSDGIVSQEKEQKSDESIEKVIVDLEALLNEALALAGQSTNKDFGEVLPLAPHVRNQDSSLSESISRSDSSSPLIRGIDEEENRSLLQRPHGKQVVVAKPQRNTSHGGNYKKARDATPFPAHSKPPSTVPDTNEDAFAMERQGADQELIKVTDTESKTSDPLRLAASEYTDWASIGKSTQPSNLRLRVSDTVPAMPQVPPALQPPPKEQQALLVRAHGTSASAGSHDASHQYAKIHDRPPIQPRGSSFRLRGHTPNQEEVNLPDVLPPELPLPSDDEAEPEGAPYVADFKLSSLNYHPVFQQAMNGEHLQSITPGPRYIKPHDYTKVSQRASETYDKEPTDQAQGSKPNEYSLKDRHHFVVREPHAFSLSRSHRRAPIARDWSDSRKRYVAIVTCITTALIGLFIGIYAGEVPAIQYAIADEHHYAILGNVFFFLGLAISTALFWPLPLLHGRKPYILASLAILLPLQFPQALAINSNRSPYVATYRVGLLLPRVFAGMVMGFVNINTKTTLLDLFGASLQSSNPHQEIVNVNDVRRHGGGMGLWLGVWTWCSIGSIGIGFLIGAGIISGLDVSWGFWITIILNAAVLVLNVLMPEVRRSPYRRSMAEVKDGVEVSRRVARGEIKMHLYSTGPLWWWEEVIAGHVLCIRMLKQPGFLVLSCYLGWIYGQVVIVIIVCLT